MKNLFNILTFLWVVIFFISLFTEGKVGNIFDIACIIVGLLFIIELIFEYRKSNNFKHFLKKNWSEFLFLIPIFRGLRLLKVIRKSKNIIRALKFFDNLFEGIDIALRLKMKKRNQKNSRS